MLLDILTHPSVIHICLYICHLPIQRWITEQRSQCPHCRSVNEYARILVYSYLIGTISAPQIVAAPARTYQLSMGRRGHSAAGLAAEDALHLIPKISREY